MSANICKPIHGIINYPTFISPFESEKCGKEGKKLQKFDYLEMKSKAFFIVLEELSFGEKIKKK